jgi:hypothetical protein
MKNLSLLLIISLTLFASCKKDDVKPSSNGTPVTPPQLTGPVTGRWIGTGGYDLASTGFYYSLNVKSNGTIEEINASNVVKGTGTWTLNGTLFHASYHPVYSSTNTIVVAVFDSVQKKLDGTWHYENNPSFYGNFIMSK